MIRLGFHFLLIAANVSEYDHKNEPLFCQTNDKVSVQNKHVEFRSAKWIAGFDCPIAHLTAQWRNFLLRPRENLHLC